MARSRGRRRESGSGRRSRSQRQRERGRLQGGSRSRSEAPEGELPAYCLELLAGRRQSALPMYDIMVEEAGAQRVVPHVCANLEDGYAIRVRNDSERHIACAVTVDGENALLRDGSLIVAPHDSRELPGFLVSKNFVGKEYVKEYRDFIFGKPKVVEGSAAVEAEEAPYTVYGSIVCEVFEAVLDEEVDSDQELRGQTTFYRGAGLHGSFDERLVPEGKKKHFLYSSVTVQGRRSSIANSTRGRWWVRGTQKLGRLEVRYREAHSLMLLGVDPKLLGLGRCKEESSGSVKKEQEQKLGTKEEEWEDGKAEPAAEGPGAGSGLVEVCDLTCEDVPAERAAWTLRSSEAAEVDPDEVLGEA